ncbi:hypothetical protein [Paenibacillus sp. An7]|uniref:hypothetical protein n=1 Tax=Paenibacillus sp. An7 TaxID=2689577 RepID=UPI001358E846|nr:hypothetical protein [Paenibacillus sp. An7]
MLIVPEYAQCNDRTKKSNTGGSHQNIMDLFNDDSLSKDNLIGLSFDFFINWKDNIVNGEIWIKRTVKSVEILNDIFENIGNEIKKIDSNQYISKMISFAKSNNFILKYKIIPEVPCNEWVEYDSGQQSEVECIIDFEIEPNVHKKKQKLKELREKIKILSGGPMTVRKGLKYGGSTLECYLAKTDTPWPGDADILLYNTNKHTQLTLVELKKHTLVDKIELHTCEHYFNGRDKTKYNRLILLADYLKVPLLVLYYSTRKEHREIIIDKLEKDHQKKLGVKVVKRDSFKVPTKSSNSAMIKQILQF